MFLTVINSLWRGDWLQQNNADNDIDCTCLLRPLFPLPSSQCTNSSPNPISPPDVSYAEIRKKGQVPYLDPSRIGVPRYQDWLRLAIWMFFLFVYSQSVQQPLENQKDPHFDAWEVLMYTMAVSYAMEGAWASVLLSF